MEEKKQQNNDDEWEEKMSTKHQRKYWLNKKTGKSTWTKPENKSNILELKEETKEEEEKKEDEQKKESEPELEKKKIIVTT